MIEEKQKLTMTVINHKQYAPYKLYGDSLIILLKAAKAEAIENYVIQDRDGNIVFNAQKTRPR